MPHSPHRRWHLFQLYSITLITDGDSVHSQNTFAMFISPETHHHNQSLYFTRTQVLRAFQQENGTVRIQLFYVCCLWWDARRHAGLAKLPLNLLLNPGDIWYFSVISSVHPMVICKELNLLRLFKVLQEICFLFILSSSFSHFCSSIFEIIFFPLLSHVFPGICTALRTYLNITLLKLLELLT